MSFVPPGAHVSPQYFRLLYTFSIRLDVIIKYELADYDILSTSFDTFQTGVIYDHVYKVFQEAGLPMQPEESFRRDYNKWSLDATPYCDSDYHDDVYGYTAIGIETPVLRFSRSSGFDSFEQIRYALQVLNGHFEVTSNKTCGMSLRVGAVTDPQVPDYQYSRSFPLRTLRNLMQLVTLCEQEINGLHPLHRCKLDWGVNPSKVLLQTDAIARMEQCRTFADLYLLWMNADPARKEPEPPWHIEQGEFADGPPAVNCNGLLSEEDSVDWRSPRMIEFLQHEGTVDFDAIYHWTKTVIRFIQFSHECGPNGLPLWLYHVVDQKRKNPDTNPFDTISFLRMIGANEQARYYETKGTYQHPPVKNHQLHPLNSSDTADPALLVPPDNLDANWVQIETWPDGPCHPPPENDLEKPKDGSNWPDLLYRDVEY